MNSIDVSRVNKWCTIEAASRMHFQPSRWRRIAFSMCIAVIGIASANCYAETVASSTSEEAKVSGVEVKNFSKTLKAGDDFYEYVNEGWLKNTPIPADQSNYGSFSEIDDEVKEAIRIIIEQAAEAHAAVGTDQQKVGDFFRSYTNVEKRNELGIAPAQPFIAEVNSVTDMAGLSKLAASLSRKGIGGPFGCYISPDAKKSDQYTVYVSQSGLTLPDRDYYLEGGAQYVEARAAMATYIQDLMSLYQLPDGETAAKNILELETKLAQLQWTRVENRDPIKTYNKKSTAELTSLLENFGINDYLAVVGVDKQEEFIVEQPSYFEGLNKLFAEVPVETWKQYFLFHVVDALAADLSEEIEKRHFAFHETTLSGIEEQKPMWRRGVEACNGILGELVGKLYVEKHFPPEAKARMEELVGNLKKAFAVRIDKLDWMSPATKKQAHEKLSKFRTKIGYPDEWKDYSKLEIKPDDLVGNYLRAAEVEHERELKKLGGPIDRNEWLMTPQTINAYYHPLMNEIVFPAAILQPPFFNLKADDAINYGAIGSVIGHEISHGFDDQGSQYDGDGNLRMWWSDEDREEFDRRAAQLTAQYNAYKPFDDMSVNGELTLGENIGDLGGMAVAHEAYLMSLEGKPAPVIDGFTGEQRFFIGWAQVWRRLYREPELRKRLLTDPHSPSQYRCNGIVANMDAFYEAFDVSPKDKIYIAPEARVRIW